MNHGPWFRKNDWPSLTRATLFVFWALFLTGAVPAFIGGVHHFVKDMRSRDFEQEARVRKESLKWTESKVAEVKKYGRSYSPEMYFRDFGECDEVRYRDNGFSGMMFMDTALTQVQDNINHGLFTMEEFRRQADRTTKRGSFDIRNTQTS